MPLWGGVSESISNGNLGIEPTSPIGSFLAVGPCSNGVDGQVYLYGKSDAGALRDELGYGDLVDRLLDALRLGGSKARAIVVPATKSVAGTKTTVQKTGSGTAVGVSGGSPTGAFQLVIEILEGGAFEEATFRYSIDGGDTWVGPITTPDHGEAYTLGPTGVSIAWSDVYPSDDSFAAGDLWTFTTTSPSCTLGDIITALDIGKETKLPFEMACVFTPTARSTWTALDGWAEEMFDGHKPIFVLTEAPLPPAGASGSQYVTTLTSEMTLFGKSDWVAVCAHVLEIQELSGLSLERGISGLVAGLTAGGEVQKSIGETQTGKLSPVLGQGAFTMKEAELMFLNDLRFIVPRQHEGLSGWFINDGNMACEIISDYQTIELRRVMNNVIRRLRTRALAYVHSEVDSVDGVVDPAGLKALEGACKGELTLLKKTFSSARIEIPEGQDVLATQKIEANINVVPKGYMKAIELHFALVKY